MSAAVTSIVDRAPLNTGAHLYTWRSDWMMGLVTAEWEGAPDSDDTAARWFSVDIVLALYVGTVEAGDVAPLDVWQHMKDEARTAVLRELEDRLVSAWERGGRRIAA